MKQIKMTILVLLVYVQNFAQTETQTSFNIKTQVGYEYNYFKSPKSLIVDDVLLQSEDLISSSIYQDIGLNFSHEMQWKRHKLKTKLTPNYKAYYQNFDDSFWNINADIKYNYNLSDTSSFLAGASLKKVIREGIDRDEDIISSPLGYTDFGTNLGMQFQAFKNNKSIFNLFYNFRDFDQFESRDISYDAVGVNLYTEQYLAIGNQIHSYGLRGFYKNIYHHTINTDNQDLNINREWRFMKLSPFYTMAFNSNIEITPGFNYFLRTDKNKTTSFSQLGPELRLKIKQSKIKTTFSFSYLARKYKSIDAKDNEGLTGEKVKFKFIKFNILSEYKISKKVMLNARVFSRIRTTNNTNTNSRAFRAFRNQYATIGLKWEL